MLFGAHVSVAGGYIGALDYAESVGAECIQIFAKSPRQWRGPAVDPAAAEHFIAERAKRDFGPVFTHTAYLINLATDNRELRAKSIPALADELVRGATLGAAGTVCHVGNDPLGDPESAAKRVAESVLEAFELAGSAGASARLLLENTAGAGRTFGSTFEELGACIANTGLPTARLGVCLDTCHAFAFGMPLDTPEGWREVVDGIAGLCGGDRLGLIHANDCMFERGSKRDRHAWVGEGRIGKEGFAAMVCMPELSDVAACLEMPGDVPIKDSTNIERLRKLRDQCS
ncbi:MAG: deoxyribonuclease IV [Coriobacteriia bacterium]|nr:deoxyribonuclease IV [Coriobacteriia bacterium]